MNDCQTRQEPLELELVFVDLLHFQARRIHHQYAGDVPYDDHFCFFKAQGKADGAGGVDIRGEEREKQKKEEGEFLI